jgi:hypothetical protein
MELRVQSSAVISQHALGCRDACVLEELESAPAVDWIWVNRPDNYPGDASFDEGIRAGWGAALG